MWWRDVRGAARLSDLCHGGGGGNGSGGVGAAAAWPSTGRSRRRAGDVAALFNHAMEEEVGCWTGAVAVFV